jgi:RNA polymerase sigma-70 factor (ECF subfamily)
VVDYGVTSCADLGISPSGAVGRGEEHKLLQLALRQLPIEMQVALELYYFERIRGPELAAVLDIPEGTVRSRLRRGIELLGQRLYELQNSTDLVESTLSNLDDWAAGLKDRRAPETPAEDDPMADPTAESPSEPGTAGKPPLPSDDDAS